MTSNPTEITIRTWMARFCCLVAILFVVVPHITSEAQSFSSGSDGSDGPLVVAPNSGTILFDPLDAAHWGKVLDPDGDGVYHFTTISIGVGSVLRLRGDKVNKPLYWLAGGDAVINGTVDLSGDAGIGTNDVFVRRQVALPGPGGYAGGAGGVVGTPVPATPGEGPGGGSGEIHTNCGTPQYCGKGGTFTGNRYLIPLAGGSGGGGALWVPTLYAGGGGGGGALLIASSTSIAVSGVIQSRGGSAANPGGMGSGGGIRLVAPIVTGNGHLDVRGGCCSAVNAEINGGPGFVRVEAFVIASSLQFDAGGTFVTRGSPVDEGTLTPPSSIRVNAIDGIPVPANPSGSFVLPDVTISKSGPVTVDIQASGIPPGTVVTLQIYPQSPADQTTVNLPTAQATLSGTLESSTATASFTFPYGFSRGYVRASWTQ